MSSAISPGPSPRHVSVPDATVAIRTFLVANGHHQSEVQVTKGERRASTEKVVKQNPGAFRPVRPDGLERDRALEAITDQAMYAEDGVELTEQVFAGEWRDRDHVLVHVNPLMWRLPPMEFLDGC